MPVELTHIGEDLIAAMLQSLASRGLLSDVTCAVTGRSLAADVDDEDLGHPLTFRSDDASVIVQVGDLTFACDGEQKIDVLCAGTERAIAIEAKLGETRMGGSEFRNRFCAPCEKSKHFDARLSGSMIAVLERSLPSEGGTHLIAHAVQGQWIVARPWWLVVRQKVFDKWRKSKSFPVMSARILTFDALVRRYGSRHQFDELVRRVVGTDFADRWGLHLGNP